MPNRRGQTNDKVGREHKRQVIQDRGAMCYMDQVGELHQEIADLQVDLGQATQKAEKYKARVAAEQNITNMYIRILATRTRWLRVYMILAAALTGYLFYLSVFTKMRG